MAIVIPIGWAVVAGLGALGIGGVTAAVIVHKVKQAEI